MAHTENTAPPRQEGYRFRGRLWLEGPDGTFLGYGRAVLLERIRDYGSISAAARSMGMSYRHAWKLVDSMNSQTPAPLVIKTTGGRGGGGATLTEAGVQALSMFWRVHEEFRQFMAERTSALQLE
ncbi:MAG: ModE family transcriptional regulator [Desulfobulbaceae bacterium A2]|nr:MAG: ModE family transcriptional regulator [Desulfobulbaceae bacterium A2]